MRAQAELTRIFQQGKFREVTFEHAGPRERPLEVSPVSVLVDETSAGFQIDRSNGRERAIRPTSWTMTGTVQFNVAVDVEEFIMRTFNPVPRVLRDGAEPGFSLIFSRYTVEHPVQKQPSHGTTLRFHVTIEPEPGR